MSAPFNQHVITRLPQCAASSNQAQLLGKCVTQTYSCHRPGKSS